MTRNTVAFRFTPQLKGRTEATCNYCGNGAGYCIEERGDRNQLGMVEVYAADLVCEIHLDKHYQDLEVAHLQFGEPTELAKKADGPIA